MTALAEPRVSTHLHPMHRSEGFSPPPVRYRSAWATIDVRRVVQTSLTGLALLGLGWFGAQRRDSPSEQMFWLGLAVCGLAVATFGDAAFLARGYALVALRRRHVVGAHPVRVVAPRIDTVAPNTLVAIEGTRYFHRSDCTFVKGKRSSTATAGDHGLAGRSACPACRP